MAVMAAVIFLLTAVSLTVQMISRSKRKCRTALVVWCDEDIPCDNEMIGIIRGEKAAGENRQIILVSADGRFNSSKQDIAEKYGVTLASAEELADIICGQKDQQVKADTWEVKNE